MGTHAFRQTSSSRGDLSLAKGDEAIQSRRSLLDRFAALAMTKFARNYVGHG